MAQATPNTLFLSHHCDIWMLQTGSSPSSMSKTDKKKKCASLDACDWETVNHGIST